MGCRQRLWPLEGGELVAELVPGGGSFIGNVAAIGSFKDGRLIRYAHSERSTWLIFTAVEGQEVYRIDLAPFGVTFIFDFTLEISSFDGRIVAGVMCFSDRAPGGNERDLKIIRTDYHAQPEVCFGETIP